MARIRIILEDDDGREINGNKERLYDLSGGATRFVDIEAAVEGLKQEALPELTAELLTLAQQQFVAEVKKAHFPGFSGRAYHRSSKASRREDLQVEEPVACWDCSSFHFYPHTAPHAGRDADRAPGCRDGPAP